MDGVLLLVLYIILLAVAFGCWLLTLNKANWEHTHDAFSLILLLLIPIIPVIMLIKALVKKQ